MRAHCLNGLGLVAIDAGRPEEAEELLKTAVAICEELETPRPDRSFSSTCRLPGSRRLGPARDIFAENLSFARANTELEHDVGVDLDDLRQEGMRLVHQLLDISSSRWSSCRSLATTSWAPQRSSTTLRQAFTRGR